MFVCELQCASALSFLYTGFFTWLLACWVFLKYTDDVQHCWTANLLLRWSKQNGTSQTIGPRGHALQAGSKLQNRHKLSNTEPNVLEKCATQTSALRQARLPTQGCVCRAVQPSGHKLQGEIDIQVRVLLYTVVACPIARRERAFGSAVWFHFGEAWILRLYGIMVLFVSNCPYTYICESNPLFDGHCQITHATTFVAFATPMRMWSYVWLFVDGRLLDEKT